MKIKGKKAISLIVLVITILVLSILAATVIISLSNTNIISQASDAVKKTEAQQIEEAKTLMYADGMLGYNPEDMIIGDYTLIWDNSKKEVIQKLGDYVIKEGAVIPTDFYYVGGTKDTGLVISDNSADENKGVNYTCEGNQFVWVPVDDYSKFVRGIAEETSEGSGIYKMTGAITDFFEPIDYGYETEEAEYNTMCESVKKYGGFYIARFEAGDATATSPRSGTSGVSTIVSKKNVYVYDYADWETEALYLSKNMYKNSTSVVSTLCYGVQWDSTLNFVSDIEHSITNIASWGNDSDDLQKTGYNEEWKVKNIYDLIGNANEYTMESGVPYGCCFFEIEGCHSVPQRVYRDGFGRNYYSLGVGSHKAPALSGVGFRVTLYLK